MKASRLVQEYRQIDLRQLQLQWGESGGLGADGGHDGDGGGRGRAGGKAGLQRDLADELVIICGVGVDNVAERVGEVLPARLLVAPLGVVGMLNASAPPPLVYTRIDPSSPSSLI